MDIVSRLKIFINSLNIGVSQFADTCNIPRPTLSQILNGRNKKISDELISKIHSSYPNLSILWLLFNEGNMTINENIPLSTPQDSRVLDFFDQQNIDIHTNTDLQSGQNSIHKSPAFKEFDSVLFDNEPQLIDDTDQHTTPNNSNPDEIFNSTTLKQISQQEANVNVDTPHQMTSKRIVSIMIFYDDNSFESFLPGNNEK